jgi:hypothetical protein
LFVIDAGKCFEPPPPGETLLQNGDSIAKDVLLFELPFIDHWFTDVFFLDHLKIAEGLGEPLNYTSPCCLMVVMLCAIGAKDENKEVGIVLHLFYKYLPTCEIFVYVFLLILFNNFFAVAVVKRIT